MASRYVRQQVKTWLADSSMTVPFYDTINLEQNPSDDIWCTVEFGFASRERMTYCEGLIEEDGDFEVIYFGRAGVGDDDILRAAETDINTFMSFRDSSGKLLITNRSSADEFTNGDVDREYGISFSVDYIYHES